MALNRPYSLGPSWASLLDMLISYLRSLLQYNDESIRAFNEVSESTAGANWRFDEVSGVSTGVFVQRKGREKQRRDIKIALYIESGKGIEAISGQLTIPELLF